MQILSELKNLPTKSILVLQDTTSLAWLKYDLLASITIDGIRYQFSKLNQLALKFENNVVPGIRKHIVSGMVKSTIGAGIATSTNLMHDDEIKASSAVMGATIALSCDIASNKYRQHKINKATTASLSKETADIFLKFRKTRSSEVKQDCAQNIKENIASGKINPILVAKHLDHNSAQSWLSIYKAWKLEQDKIRQAILSNSKIDASYLEFLKDKIYSHIKFLIPQKKSKASKTKDKELAI